jgi:hypothetical protein
MLQESSRLVIVSRSTAQQRRLTKGEEQEDIAANEDQRARTKAAKMEKDKILQHEEEEPQTWTALPLAPNGFLTPQSSVAPIPVGDAGELQAYQRVFSSSIVGMRPARLVKR